MAFGPSSQSPAARAAERYQALLADGDPAATWQALSAAQAEQGLTFGARPICQVLRPHFVDEADFEAIARATALVVGAVHRLYRYLRDRPAELIAALALDESEQVLLEVPDVYGRPDASTRMDAFWHAGPRPGEGQPHFLEYNSESPGGIAFGEALSAVFAATDPGRAVQREFSIQAPPLRPQVHATLLGCYADLCRATGRQPRSRPTIAIVDWAEARTRREFELSAETFEQLGSPTLIIDPAELDYSGGQLWAPGGVAVDIVYKRVVVNELIQHTGSPAAFREHPLVRAALDGAVCIANGLTVQLLFSKAWFALLHAPELQHLFDADQAAAIRSHIPWTVRVEDRAIERDGRRVELLRHLRDNREGYVLKPAKDYGGRGVVIGREVDAASWDTALAAAVASPHVAQAWVSAPSTAFPVWQDDGLTIAQRLIDIDPYVWRGDSVFHGGVRLGTEAILNVSAGGGSATPLWLVRD